MIYYSIYKSPIGDIMISSTEKGISGIDYITENGLVENGSYSGEKYVENTERNIKYINQLELYFNGLIKNFDVDMDISGTDFQKKVWNELIKIPYGHIRTYKDISQALASCPRAVGQANKKNPLPIIIPCHRVVSVSGIGGYGGETGGLNIKIKRYLLELEGFDCKDFFKFRKI